MKKMILALICLLFSLGSFSQTYYKEYITEKAIGIVNPSTVTETYVYDFDQDGDPIYAERAVPSFNYGVEPVLLDSLSFYSLRDSLIADSNFVFSEVKISDFDDLYCYECDSLINPDYQYEKTGYRTIFGSESAESFVKQEKFIYLFVGQDKGVYYLHSLMGAEREF
jgi:hypothetical protein